MSLQQQDSNLSVITAAACPALERQDLSRTYLAHHELESVVIIITIIEDAAFSHQAFQHSAGLSTVAIHKDEKEGRKAERGGIFVVFSNHRSLPRRQPKAFVKMTKVSLARVSAATFHAMLQLYTTQCCSDRGLMHHTAFS